MNGTETVETHQFKHQALLSREKLFYDFLNESFSFRDRMLVLDSEGYAVRIWSNLISKAGLLKKKKSPQELQPLPTV